MAENIDGLVQGITEAWDQDPEDENVISETNEPNLSESADSTSDSNVDSNSDVTDIPSEADDPDVELGDQDPPVAGDSPAGDSLPAQGHAGPAPPAEETLDLNSLTQRYFGRTFTQPEAVQFLQLAKDFSNITPEQGQAINSILAGQPQGHAGPATPAPQGAAPPAPPALVPAPAPTPAPASTPEYVDPELAAALNPIVESQRELQAKYDALQAQQQQIDYQRAQASTQQVQQTINSAHEIWKSQRPNLNLEDNALIEAKVIGSPTLFPAFLQANNGDHTKATHALLDHIYWTNPEFQTREVEARLVQERQAQIEQKNRTQKSTALSGGEGPRPAAAGARPVSSEDRYSGLVAGIADALSGGQPT